MTTKIFTRNFLAMAAVIVLAAGLALLGADSASATGKGNGRIIAVTGLSSADGEQVIVHILASAQAGKSDQEVADAALNGVNARAITWSDYSLLANSWDQFFDGVGGNDFVTQRYNSKDEPLGARAAVDRSRATWNAADSPFAFEVGMESVGKCPSLVQECKGRQTFDGYNDIAWMPLRDANTLAVTWSGTSTDEADVAFNTNFTWSNDNPASAIDIETVALHEFGHVAGIGHSDVELAIMEPVYAGVRRSLTADDIAALQAWYGSGSGSTPTPTPEPTATPEPGDNLYIGAVDSPPVDGDGVAYSLSGKKGRDMIISVTITSDGLSIVEAASVSITASNSDTGWSGSGTTTTNSSGEARFRVRNADAGSWTTTVVDASLGSQSCAECPNGPHTFTK
jgi:hypothetical protein